MLSFAAKQGDNNPLAHRKQALGNLFTAREETTLEFEATTQTPIGVGVALFKRVGELLGITKEKGAADEKRFGDITQAVEMLATFSREQATRPNASRSSKASSTPSARRTQRRRRRSTS